MDDSKGKMPLPPSFISNTLGQMIQFLNESNHIESITEINYQDKKHQTQDKGHFGALVYSQQLGCNQAPLSVRHIRTWQSLLTREQLGVGHHIEEHEIGVIRGPNLEKNVRVGSHIPPTWDRVPLLLSCLIEDINEGLKKLEKLKTDDVAFCKFLGESLQTFEAIHPFADGNGRTGRLLANYIATYCGRPMMIFDSEMTKRNRYYDAHRSKKAMVRWIAQKLPEVIFKSGTILFQKTTSPDGVSTYQSKDGKEEGSYNWKDLETLLIEKEDGKENNEKSSE